MTGKWMVVVGQSITDDPTRGLSAFGPPMSEDEAIALAYAISDGVTYESYDMYDINWVAAVPLYDYEGFDKVLSRTAQERTAQDKARKFTTVISDWMKNK